jgi:transposase
MTGSKLIYLPPYSPDMNPIEQVFHSVKAWLRRHEDYYTSIHDQHWLMQQAAMSVTLEDIDGFIRNSGYA